MCWDGVNGHTPSLGLLRAALTLHTKYICALLLPKSVLEAAIGKPGPRAGWQSSVLCGKAYLAVFPDNLLLPAAFIRALPISTTHGG